MKVPKIDSDIGIAIYSSTSDGIGGRIKAEPGDFEVAEVLYDAGARITDGPGYAVYLLKKQGVDTMHALAEIKRGAGLRLKTLGLKDAQAVTEQYACSTRRSEPAGSFESSRCSIRHVGYCDKPLSKKDMRGNRFRIKITDGQADPPGTHPPTLNFYGYQRFGSQRPVTHLIGKSLVCGDWEGAVRYILSYTSEYDSEENNKIRQQLVGNYSEMLERLPRKMDIEWIVLSGMARHGDARRAVAELSAQMRRLYVQAYQSYIFNRTLSAAHEAGEELYEPQEGDVCFDGAGRLGRYGQATDQMLAVPYVGYGYYAKTRFDGYIRQILAEEGVRPGDFYLGQMQEASRQAGFRHASMQVSDYTASGSTVSFLLTRGSYATVLLREIIKPSDPLGAGF